MKNNPVMNTRRLSRFLKGRPSGQTLWEFGYTSVVFLMLLFGIMEIAQAVNAYNDISSAAREAARYAMVHSPTSSNNPCPTGTGVQCAAVQNQAVSYAPFLSATDVSATFSNPTNPAQDYAVVVITHTYPLSIPFTAAVNLNLSASSRMLVAQ
jgi:Flp pilus assembly protein TadG